MPQIEYDRAPGNTLISLTQALQANELLSVIGQDVTDLRSHLYVTATLGSYSAGTYTNPSFTITAGQIADALTYRELDYYAGKTDSNNLTATGGNPFTIGVASSHYGSSLGRKAAIEVSLSRHHAEIRYGR